MKYTKQEQLYRAILDLGLKGALPYKLKESSFKDTLNNNRIDIFNYDNIDELNSKTLNDIVLKSIQSSSNNGSKYVFTGDMHYIDWIIGMNGGINFNYSSFSGNINVTDIPSIKGTYFLIFPSTFNDGVLNTSNRIDEIKTIPIGYTF